MPNKCSAPSCRSNYDGEPHTPVFKLPQDKEIAEKWLHALHRVGILEIKNVLYVINTFVLRM